ncbi:MAG: PSD1 and planctomycete cytochrome C domain-containing protein [Planctomycetota bacterium]|jgi:hypothetical protein
MHRPLALRVPVIGLLAVLAPGVATAFPADATAPPAAIDFARDVRPLLADRCLPCHGPDAATRRADLRLDVERGAVAARDGRAVIDRADPGRSLLLERVRSRDPESRMPPPEAGPPLDADEVALLERWIEQGAPWREHWSFVAPRRPAVPDVGEAGRPRNAIDAFVLRRLREAGLDPAPEADRRTLIRRLSLDLTGLPPAPEDIDAFLADDRPGAYDRLVDRLLASPHFGERMALEWLDRARYADTNGYSIDGGRHMWAWRDWVIDAFNRNLPFDRFTVEQLAGDLLPDPTTGQRMASGFNRNHMNTHEGGTIEEEYRVAYVADRVKTTAQTWMGLTLGCAQCHDHKYDPVSQREYYRFFAYFNTITDRGNDGNAGINSVPYMPVYAPEQREALAALTTERESLRARLLAPDPELDAAQRAWEETERRAGVTPPVLGPWHLRGPLAADSGEAAFTTDFGPETGIDLDTAGDAGEPLWVVREDLVDGTPHPLTGQRSAFYLYRTVTAARPARLELSLGSDDAIRAWLNGALVLDRNVQRGVAPDQERVAVDLRAGPNELLLKIVNYGGPAGFYFSSRAGLPPEVAAILARDPAGRGPEEELAVRSHYRSIAPELAPLRAEIASVEERIDAIEAEPKTTVMIMEEMDEPRATFVLERGRYDLPGERVDPGTPSCLPPLPDGARPDRLGLARWLVDPEHPLTARVAVNGWWQMLFGAGLVRTPEDFGLRGELPSHPELLDWLAVELVERDWNVKALLRLIVTSATYRQSSAAGAALLARDPDNRLLARGPRFRLPAELVRDTALSASGLLVPTIGGPSVRPYQPDGLWREMSHFGSTPATEQVYVQDHGDKLYRRSLYTIWKRTVPPPVMAAFDAPNRELCTVRRASTNTPLQALVLLNETGFVEAARALAERILTEGGPAAAERLRLGFVLATGRPPDGEESAILLAALERERARFAGDPDAAAALLAVGEHARDATLDPVEHAAWTVLASLLLNLSETITRS